MRGMDPGMSRLMSMCTESDDHKITRVCKYVNGFIRTLNEIRSLPETHERDESNG